MSDDNGAYEMDGRKFLLYIVLPLLVAFAVLFLVFGPEEPLGGPNRFVHPDTFEKAPGPAPSGE